MAKRSKTGIETLAERRRAVATMATDVDRLSIRADKMQDLTDGTDFGDQMASVAQRLMDALDELEELEASLCGELGTVA